MDPATAIGVASGILSFVTFSASIAKAGIEIYQFGGLNDTSSLEAAVNQTNAFFARLEPDYVGPLTENEWLLIVLLKDSKSVSDELLELLAKTKIPGGKPLKKALGSLKAAWNNAINKEDRKALEGKLASIQERVTGVLTQLTRIEVKDVADIVRNQDDRLCSIQDSIDTVFDTLSVLLEIESLTQSAAKDIKAQVEKLADVNEKTIKAVRQQRVLEGLKYDKMVQRSSDLGDTLCKISNNEDRDPFCWLFDADEDLPQSAETELDMRQRAKEEVSSWLSSPADEILHIAGKPGSGKSTLMKYLFEQQKTKSLLEKWAAERELLVVDFFFSVLVGESQQTINALSRSILHDIIKKRPDLTPIFLKDAWKRAIEFHWQDNTKITIGHQEAWPALKHIIAELGNKGIRLCLFIDGLDEFKGKWYDWDDLVDRLHELSPQSNPHVKMCAASRAEPPFTTRLRARRIFLHEVTRQDILQFADWRLKAIEDKDDRLSFARKIADKADGIFLWAQLVIQNIRLEIGRRGRNSKVGIDILDQYTGDLENLFKDLVDSIRKPDRSKVYLTVRSLEVLQEYNLRLSPLALSFRDRASTESDFASQVMALMLKMKRKEKEDKTDDALIELASISRGFLEANSDRSEVKFIHRSAQDYLKRERKLQNASEGDG
ncbi:hypothetical protein BKA56DRAFT_675928 [Ilyonectria sp. MPI-CAGE-AT-0026]|nr:hypothetical protein BKA56DRAFT_675928 [Ilyonectria sp. MPI-CAGE-AT-0026]